MDTFLTVTKQSSNRALDMPASYVATLRDGEEIFVESYGRKFVWDTTFPSGTATVDGESFRPTSWTANGAFVADLRGSEKYWRQSAWFVSTAGDDENDGLTSSTPVKTDVEIQRRWGVGRRARISLPVTITYAQSPSGQTNLIFKIASGGSMTFVGTPTVSKAGTVLTAVQTQVRTVGLEAAWAITGPDLGASEVGKIAIITNSGTPANIGAYAPIIKDETGGKLRTGPFGTFAVSNSAPFVQVTPQVGDTIEIRDMAATTLSVGRIDFTSEANENVAASPSRQVVVFDSLKIDGGSAINGTVVNNSGAMLFARSALTNLVLQGNQVGTSITNVAGGLGSLVVVRYGSVVFRQTAFTGLLSCGMGGVVQLNTDVYFQNAQLTAQRGASVTTVGVGFFDRTVSDASLFISTGGGVQQSGAIPDWGTANAGHGIKVQSGGHYSYSAKPTINSGLGAGREALIGGTDKLYSEVPFINTNNNAALVLTA